MNFEQILSPYKTLIEKEIEKTIVNLGTENRLKEACKYALLNGGKRFRPAIVLMIAQALDKKIPVVEAAIGIECFHTASLIADDLPCMDDDDQRRKMPAVHAVYGESTAILSTYALIAAGYRFVIQNAASIKKGAYPLSEQIDSLCLQAIDNICFNTGIQGATGGQYLDLLSCNNETDLKEIFYKKTGSLFEISFVLGWIFGGGDVSQLELVKKSAAHFGMAFQIADDIGDMQQDLIPPVSPNIANLCGYEVAKQMFHEEIQLFNQTLFQLKLDKSDLSILSNLLRQQIVSNDLAYS